MSIGSETQSGHDVTRGQGTPSTRREAAHAAVARTTTHVRLPVVGEVTLPPASHLAWYGGVFVLAALELIEWPIAAVLALGKALSDDRNNQSIEEFGRALEEV